jgi:hypothetical protein
MKPVCATPPLRTTIHLAAEARTKVFSKRGRLARFRSLKGRLFKSEFTKQTEPNLGKLPGCKAVSCDFKLSTPSSHTAEPVFTKQSQSHLRKCFLTKRTQEVVEKKARGQNQ